MEDLDRITRQSNVMGGKACIRDTQITVGMIAIRIRRGHSIEKILGDYPVLDREDILQALRYVASNTEYHEIDSSDGSDASVLSGESDDSDGFDASGELDSSDEV